MRKEEFRLILQEALGEKFTEPSEFDFHFLSDRSFTREQLRIKFYY
jgi:hypothetical protein